jgi:hypothetical protein
VRRSFRVQFFPFKSASVFDLAAMLVVGIELDMAAANSIIQGYPDVPVVTSCARST